MTWSSTVDGNLSNQYNFNLVSSNISAGIHTINLTVSDNDGLWSRQASLTLTVHQLPTASITSVSSHLVSNNTSVNFTGSGSDSDGNITSYSWRSSIDGFLNSSANFSTSSLSLGNHTIYFMVLDSNGLWSSEASTWVRVNYPPLLSNYSLGSSNVARTNSIVCLLYTSDAADE